MSKREVIEVDEDVIKKMIAGDMPNAINPVGLPVVEEKKNLQENNSVHSQRNQPTLHAVNNEDTESKYTKKKKSKLKYEEIFLVQQKYSETKQTTIILDKKIYSLIKNILKTTDRTTLANFINNVMHHHFKEYKDEIDEVKKEYISNLYNDKEL